MNTTNYEALMS